MCDYVMREVVLVQDKYLWLKSIYSSKTLIFQKDINILDYVGWVNYQEIVILEVN